MITMTDKRQTPYFGGLKEGETFLAKGCRGKDILYIKLYGGDSGAVNLENGVIVEFDYYDKVLPVDVEVNIIK